jgi:hypothetical protein
MNAMKLLLAALLAARPQASVPDPTLPPPTAQVRLVAVGYGVQIYRCDVQNGSFQWTFQEPDAILMDPATRQQIGTHGAGPTWTANDGSSVAGKVLAKRPSDDTASIPWLLVETHAVGSTAGMLSGVSLVRRSETKAGSAPATGCDAQHGNVLLRVPYEATYTFYATQ